MLRVLLLVAVLLAVDAAAAQAALPLSVVQDDARLLRSGPAARERTLDDAASLGVDVVRVLVVWRDVARQPAALEELDAVIAGARARGLRVLLNPSGPGPLSASGCRPRREVCAPSATGYGEWVAALGRRYPDVRDWSIWNEPNNPNWLQPQRAPDGRPTSPARYRALVAAAVAGLRSSGHGADLVLAGETAPMPAATSRPPAQRPVAAHVFLPALLAGSRSLGVTGLAHHPYTTDLRTPFGERGAAQYTLAGVPRLQALVRAAVRRGVLPPRAPLWLTEQGFQTDPPDAAFGISPARQADWLSRVERRAQVLGVAASGQYLLRDEAALGRFQSGLRFADGRAKPSWAAYRLPLVAEGRGSRVLLRGRVRPVDRAGAAYAVEHRRRPGPVGRILQRRRTTAGGGVATSLVRRAGWVRLRWTAPDGRVHRGAWVRLP